MKRIFLMVLALLPLTGWSQNSSFTLTAKISGKDTHAKAYLIYRSGDIMHVDSTRVNQGAFRFKGVVEKPILSQLVLDHKGAGLEKIKGERDILMLYLENKNISLTAKDSVKNASIKGSKINDENLKYKAFISIQGKTTEAETLENKRTLQLKYIKENPNSYLSLVALEEIAGPLVDVPTIKPIYENLSEEVRNTIEGKEFRKLINAVKSASIGETAPDFTQNDSNGKAVHLNGFRGKYVLLDFWASWCGPCRKENPNLVKAFNQYKDKNFTVLSVSLDNVKKLWLEAIKKDSLSWTNVTDFNGWHNDAAAKYGVKQVPQNYLIDPDGKIIGKNLRGAALTEKLKEIYDINFTIKGAFSDVRFSKIFINYSTGERNVHDSIDVKNGAFEYKGKIEESDPIMAYLMLEHPEPVRNGTYDHMEMFISKTTFTLAGKDSIAYAAIKNSKLNEDYVLYKKQLTPLGDALTRIKKEYNDAAENRKKDSLFSADIAARQNVVRKEIKDQQTAFVKGHPDSYLSILLLKQSVKDSSDIKRSEPIFNNLSSNVRNTEEGKTFKKLIESIKIVAIGKTAPDFTQNDVNDKPVKLSDFHGKYVLLDFWASWCGPCRAENPNVLKAYKKYKDKNFTVLGVSLDQPGKKKEWLAAIKADGLEWMEVSDLKYWNNEAVKLYGIRSIPQNFLIDPNGIIIAKDLRGEELDKKLAELLEGKVSK